MRENLFFKTETLPEEIPILFNNKNLYNNFTRTYVENIIIKEKKDKKIFSDTFTVPYHFFIPKNDSNLRKMSLLHPYAQLQMFNYITKYEQMIVNFCKQSNFSVRSPIIRNKPVFNHSYAIQKEKERLEDEFSFSADQSITSDETMEYFYNYFSYKRHKRITDLYKSNKFRRDLYKYKYFKKLDIQNFFGSIYSHSIAWAIFGEKSIAKKYTSKKYANIFPNASDKICQLINFNETNGIVVGPEFSRILSEILLSKVDIDLYHTLEAQKLVKEKDYKIYRFMDDYHIFFNKSSDLNLIEENLIKSLDIFNLKLNSSKSLLQNKPFQINDGAITKLIYIIDTYRIDKNDNAFQFRSKTEKIRDNIELLIIEHPNSTTKILNYFLKYIRSLINFKSDKISLSIILELITNLYSLKINYHSTHNLIATYAILTQKIKKIKKSYNSFDDNEIYEKIIYLEERSFQNLFVLLKNNDNQINQMYDVFIYMKSLNKKINSDFLCKILHYYKDNYFVLCSIAYYILDDDLKEVSSNFKTVLKVLKKIITNFSNNYSNKGATFLFFESEYFYILNDFSHYPGFDVDLKESLSKELLKNSPYKDSSRETLNEIDHSKNKIIRDITEDAYYDWCKTSDYFIKEIAKKSSNLLNRLKIYN